MQVDDRAVTSGKPWLRFLEHRPDTEVVAQAGSLKEARRHIASVGCDVAVLDLGLPDGNGADLIGELSELCVGAIMRLGNG